MPQGSLDYDRMKSAILHAYELVPEAFRRYKKPSSLVYVEFAREKSILFDEWITACEALDFLSLKELMLIKKFKRCLLKRIVTYLNEQKVTTLTKAVVLAEKFYLTHKSAFTVSSTRDKVVHAQKPSEVKTPVSATASCLHGSSPSEARRFFYCHKVGHVIADCDIFIAKGDHKTQRSNLKPESVC